MSKLKQKMDLAGEIFSRAVASMRDHVEFDQTFSKDQRKAIVGIASVLSARPPILALSLMVGIDQKDRARIMAKAMRAAADVLTDMARDPDFGSATITDEDIADAEKEMG